MSYSYRCKVTVVDFRIGVTLNDITPNKNPYTLERIEQKIGVCVCVCVGGDGGWVGWVVDHMINVALNTFLSRVIDC